MLCVNCVQNIRQYIDLVAINVYDCLLSASAKLEGKNYKMKNNNYLVFNMFLQFRT